MSHHKHDRTERVVTIAITRHGERTHAEATLRWHHTDLVGLGDAMVDSEDRFPERTGEELAVARALTHLTRQLFVRTAGDVESVIDEPVSVR